MAASIADLHCDLLCYLEYDSKRSPFDHEPRCGIEQLKEGNVRLQVLAVFTPTEKGSVLHGEKQAEIFKVLANKYPDYLELVQSPTRLESLWGAQKTGIIAAIENSSVFAEEDEDLDVALVRLRNLFGKVGRPLYVSLTWNDENRFAGGTDSKSGLKDDGEELIRFLANKNIALDISHASDQTAEDVFNFIDKESIEIKIIASHSNLRSVCDHPRNLPDVFAKEIIRRNGLIGLNMVQPFIGDDVEKSLLKQIEAFYALGAEKTLCFGADYFCEADAVKWGSEPPETGYFFDEWGDSSMYGRMLEYVRRQLNISTVELDQFSHNNIQDFIFRLWN